MDREILCPVDEGRAIKKNTETNTRLTEEIKTLRQRIAELEAAQKQRERVGSLPQGRGDSETSLSDLIEATHDLVQSVAPDGQFVFVNRAWRETLGYTDEEVSRLKLWDIVHPDYQSHCAEIISRVIAGESIRQVQAVFVAKDGKSVAVEGDATGRYVGGEVVATQSVFHDVTERKKVEEALRKSEVLLRKVVTGAPIVLWAVDSKGVFTLSEGKGLDALGLKPGEVVGQSVFEVYRDVPQILQDIRRGLSGEHFMGQVEVAGRVFESRYTPLGNEKGEAVELIGVSLDITERKQAEEAARASETRLDEILDIAHDAIISVDEGQRITLFNQAAERMFGYRTEEVMNEPLDILLPPRFVEAHRTHIGNFAASPVAVRLMNVRGSVFGYRKDGTEFPAEASISKIGGDGEKIFTVFLRDITEAKQAEAELNQRLRELESLNRLFQQHLRERFGVVEAYRELLDSLETQSVTLSDLIKRARSHPLPDLRDVVNFEPYEQPRSEQ